MIQNFILRLPAVMKAFGISRTSIYQGVKDGTFPAPIRLGPRCVGWTHASLMDWLETRPPAGGRRKTTSVVDAGSHVTDYNEKEIASKSRQRQQARIGLKGGGKE